MKLNVNEFKRGLNRCVGIVKDQGNIEVLKSFYLKPDITEGKVYLAGSDGSMSFLDKINAEFSDEEIARDIKLKEELAKVGKTIKDTTEDVIILPSSKLFPIAKCSSGEIEIIADELSAVVKSGDREWKIRKIQEEYTDVPFYCYDVDQFTDTVDGAGFVFILERLASNIQNVNDPNPVYRQLYMDGEKAYSASTSFVTIANYETNGKYIFKDKVVRALRDMLRGYSGELNLTYGEDEISVIVRTDTSVFVYTSREEGEIQEIDEMEALHLENAVAVDKQQLLGLLNSAKITSGDDKAEFFISALEDKPENYVEGKLVPGVMGVRSEDSTGATFNGTLNLVIAKRTPSPEEATGDPSDNIIEGIQAFVNLTDIISALNIIDSPGAVIRYSTNGIQNISVSDQKNRYRSILLVED